jgi:hypothetical protein
MSKSKFPRESTRSKLPPTPASRGTACRARSHDGNPVPVMRDLVQP